MGKKIDDNLLSVDLGYSSAKYYFKRNGKEIFGKIPTAIFNLPDDTKTDDYLEYKGKKYLIGDKAIIKRDIDLEMDIENLIKYAPLFICEIIMQNDINTDGLNLITGLSIKDLAFDSKLIDELSNFKIGDIEYKINVSLLPQGRGISYDYFRDKKMAETVAIMDIGYHTFDFVALYDGKMDLDDSFANSDGVNLALKEVVNKIYDRHNIERNTAEINSAVLGNKMIFHRGKSIDISDIVFECVEEYLKKTKKMCDSSKKVNQVLDRANLIIVGGGGAYLLKTLKEDKISEIFGGANITFCEEPCEFSNARGYYIRQNSKV